MMGVQHGHRWAYSHGVESGLSKAALANAARARAGEPLPTSDCLLRHGLVQGVAEEGWNCDVCGDGVDEGVALKWCSRCGYIVCSSCQGQGAAGGGKTKKKGKKGKKGRGRNS